MGFIKSSLDRQQNEDLLQFDYRVTNMPALVGGCAFFDMRNYDAYSGEFGLYIEWDEHINNRLNDSLPSGGYYIKATMKQAVTLHELGQGLPVYMLLVSREGRIYARRTYTVLEGRPFSIEFNGGRLIPFEDRTDLFQNNITYLENTNKSGSQSKIGSQSRFGSQNFMGSQNRYGSQSFIGSESKFGSQSFMGSQSKFGSQSYMSSQNRYGSQSFMGSQSKFGSQSFMGSESKFGSQSFSTKQILLKNHIANGSQMKFASPEDFEARQNTKVDTNQISQYISEYPPEWQLINQYRRPTQKKGGNGRFGYGLDLI